MAHVIYPKIHDLGNFQVRRVLPLADQRMMIGPWVFFDHFGPTVFPAGQGIDVRPHPHINLATVTYLIDGQITHRDSLGNTAVIAPKDINLMVAGKGIVHSERQSNAVKAHCNRIEGLQLWMALPEEAEECEPSFHHFDAAEIPEVDVEGVTVRLLIGSVYGIHSPVKTHSETVYLEACLGPGQNLKIPDQFEGRALYLVNGRLTDTQGMAVEPQTMVVFDTRQKAAVMATEESRLVLIGGESLPPRQIWWNFVSSRISRIEEAKRAWVEGKFPKIPGDENDFIPLPDDHAM